MDKFLGTYNHPQLKQEYINHLSRYITSKETEAVIVSPKKSRTEFHKTFKEEIIPIFLNLFHELERVETLPKSFYEDSITLIPKLDKDTTKKENYKLISLMNLNAKILNKILVNNTSKNHIP
jgi:hypothetical protein